MFDLFGKTILTRIIALGTQPASDAMTRLFANQKALTFAKESLRAKYQPMVHPASYEGVTDQLRLTRQDFLEFFQAPGTCTVRDLRTYLRDRLRERARGWVYNRPTEEVFSKIVTDFYTAYERFFLTTDPSLATLHLQGLSEAILELVGELRADVARFARDANVAPPDDNELDAFSTLLTVLGLPYELVERGHRHLDVVVTDPQGMFATQLYMSLQMSPSSDSVDASLRRALAHGGYGTVHFVFPKATMVDVTSYIDRRGSRWELLGTFRRRLLANSPNERYVVGSISARALLESLNVHEVFVMPHAASAAPGDYDEGSIFADRTPSDRYIDGFLQDARQHVLLILGDYGSGKSALCAYLTRRYGQQGSAWVPVYLALRQLTSADKLESAILKASQLGNTISKSDQRVLLILDGLDEMHDAMLRKERRFNVLRILEASQNVDKIIVTARKSYFRGLADFWQLFAGQQTPALWDELIRRIGGRWRTPGITAILLHDFNNAQILEYVRQVGSSRGNEEGFLSQFLTELRTSDPRDVYGHLARNPLYLFLLVNTEPWRNPSVQSLGDVLKLFVRYWLARDVEKGPSRWLFSIYDRMEFLQAFAWWLFDTRRLLVSFIDFDAFVSEFYEGRIPVGELGMVALDLQTTGMIATTAGSLHFAVPAFQALLVAERFLDGFADGKWPTRLPTPEQARLLAGLGETRGLGFWEDASPDAVGQWLVTVEGSKSVSATERLSLDPTGILYSQADGNDRSWTRINEERGAGLRKVLNAALAGAPRAKEPVVRAVFRNEYGLHARPIMRISETYRRWASENYLREARVSLLAHGVEADLGSPMEMMLLEVRANDIVELRFRGCGENEREDLMVRLGAARDPEDKELWIVGKHSWVCDC